MDVWLEVFISLFGCIGLGILLGKVYKNYRDSKKDE